MTVSSGRNNDTVQTAPDIAPGGSAAGGASDLSRLCLPAQYRDENRKLAWTNSICALFLMIGLVGLKPPQVHVRELARPEEIIPIVLTQPEEITPQEKAPDPTDEPPPVDVLDETPVVATVVAVNSPSIAFSVPVKGPTVIAPARFAQPPPPQSQQTTAPKITRFVPNSGDRSTPQPEYPLLALKRGYEGRAVVNFTIEESGFVSKVTLAETSGFSVLDESAINTIKNRWRFPAGERRHHYVEIIFKLN